MGEIDFTGYRVRVVCENSLEFVGKCIFYGRSEIFLDEVSVYENGRLLDVGLGPTIINKKYVVYIAMES